MTPYLGAICLFAFDFPPRGWTVCAGQLLPIAQNQALFALLGTMYGGNGQTTFALPDLRGRVPMHVGQGAGLPAVVQGELGGSENVTLLATQIPAHNHIAFVNNGTSTVSTPAAGNSIAVLKDINNDNVSLYNNAAANTQLNANMIGMTGGNQPHSNMQPYLAMNYSIALAGIFPSRN
jgi:microcystin-dependent protein